MMNFNKLKTTWLAFVLVPMLFVTSCKEKVEPIPDPVASFQYTVDPDEDGSFLKVTFANYSQNAESYAWDFGDTNSSTEESPTHTYAAAGNYTVTLTATNTDGKTAEKSETLSISDPDAQLTLLAGLTSKEWILQREGIALGIGPAPQDVAWWSFGGVTPLGDRPCILDDTYTFYRDGSFENNTNGTFFNDSEGNGGWNDAINGGEGCVDETHADAWTTSSGGDMSVFANGGSYTFDFDATANTLDVIGAGAYIGLPSKSNNGDLGPDGTPASSYSYTIELAEGAVADTMKLAMQVGADDVYWNFWLVSYHNAADMPDIPILLPAAGFNFTANDLEITFENTSNAAAVNFSWEFGDGSTSTDENPVHTYASAGTYDVTLTVDDGNGNTDFETKSIDVGIAIPAPTTMGHTFVDAAGADLLSLISGNSVITLGQDDPADAGAAKVGMFERVTTEAYQEAKLTFDPASDIDFNNLTTVSIDVYLPSSNDHSGSLTRTVIVGLADAEVNPSGNWWEDHAQYETTLTDQQMDQWVTLTYDLATPNSGANTSDPDTRMDLDMIFINIGGGGHNIGGTFYVRNLKFE